jgi:hypothetical protein
VGADRIPEERAASAAQSSNLLRHAEGVDPEDQMMDSALKRGDVFKSEVNIEFI